MTILSVLATIFGVVNGFANFPQIWKIYKRKSAKDISVITYIILLIGTVVWLFYGIEIRSIPILTMESLVIVEFTLILFGCYLYGRKK